MPEPMTSNFMNAPYVGEILIAEDRSDYWNMEGEEVMRLTEGGGRPGDRQHRPPRALFRSSLCLEIVAPSGDIFPQCPREEGIGTYCLAPKQRRRVRIPHSPATA